MLAANCGGVRVGWCGGRGAVCTEYSAQAKCSVGSCSAAGVDGSLWNEEGVSVMIQPIDGTRLEDISAKGCRGMRRCQPRWLCSPGTDADWTAGGGWEWQGTQLR